MGTMKLIKLISVLCATICVTTAQYPGGTTGIMGSRATAMQYSLYNEKLYDCLYRPETNDRFPVGRSIEGLISLIQRLEDNLANTTDGNLRRIVGADAVARLILRRFRLDGFDGVRQEGRWSDLDEIATAFLGRPEDDSNYYFPDSWFTRQELCSLLQSFSHNLIIQGRTRVQTAPVFNGRVKRQAIANRFEQPVSGNYLVNYANGSGPAISEEGVVSFRGNRLESIAPSRVLVGIIVGLSQNVKSTTSDVLSFFQLNTRQEHVKNVDPVMALTLGDLWGSAIAPQSEDKTFHFSITGEWSSTACNTYYGLPSIPEYSFDNANKQYKATRAQLRGGLDGYLIGSSLKSKNVNSQNTRLSDILRAYYSKPRQATTSSIPAVTLTYCDRFTVSSLITQLQEAAQTFNWIYQYKKDGLPEKDWLRDNTFTSALTVAAQTENEGLSDYCSQKPSIPDKNAPCETPSDIIFIIDAKDDNNRKISSDVVRTVLGNLQLTRRDGGATTIFLNSQGSPQNGNIQLPTGPGTGWPLIPVAFNTSNSGCATCRINDYNTSFPTPVPNLGKFFLYLNQTLFNYKYWSPRANSSGVPGKTVVIVDLNSIPAAPDSGQDRDDYNRYRDQLVYRNRDVKYLLVAQSKELFKEILLDDINFDTPGSATTPNNNLGPNFAKRICDNPALFQWHDCYHAKSNGAQYSGFVTPGYKQNWAMYPEFFLRSFNIEFKFRAESGSIRVCYDRHFPPERQEEWYCKDLNQGEEKIYDISNPCKGRNIENCDPFYFTVWGREVQQPCNDARCSSADQIKWSVTHSGVQCSASLHLSPSLAFQSIAIVISALFYLLLNSDNKR